MRSRSYACGLAVPGIYIWAAGQLPVLPSITHHVLAIHTCLAHCIAHVCHVLDSPCSVLYVAIVSLAGTVMGNDVPSSVGPIIARLKEQRDFPSTVFMPAQRRPDGRAFRHGGGSCWVKGCQQTHNWASCPKLMNYLQHNPHLNVQMGDSVRPTQNDRAPADRRQQSLHTAVTSDSAASDALAYAAVTDRILRDKRPAKQHTGYSKLAAIAVPVTDSLHVSNTNAEQRKLKRKKRLEAKLYNKATCPAWLWTEDRQLKHTVFTEIQALLGCKFTLDAASNDDGSNAHCTGFCSDCPSNSFLDGVCTGHMWINAPFTQLMPFLQHYLHCKQLNPDSTSACILIPGYLLKPMRSMLGSMRLLKRYSKGSQLFTTPTKLGNRAAMPGAHWPVYVYTDVPADVMDRAVEGTPLHALHNCTLHATDAVPDCQPLSTDKHLTMLFEGGTTKQCLSYTILMDTGASATSSVLNY